MCVCTYIQYSISTYVCIVCYQFKLLSKQYSLRCTVLHAYFFYLPLRSNLTPYIVQNLPFSMITYSTRMPVHLGQGD